MIYPSCSQGYIVEDYGHFSIQNLRQNEISLFGPTSVAVLSLPVRLLGGLE